MCDFFRNLRFQFLCSGLFLLCALTVEAQAPVSFIENKNQWPEDVQFVCTFPGGRMALGPGSFKYVFVDHDKLASLHHQSHEPDGLAGADELIRAHAVFADFANANKDATPMPFGQSEEYHNYFIGNDPSKWASRAYGYEGVFYESFYPGIDLKVYAAGENVKYDLIVAPGGNPAQIHVVYHGADEIALDNGNLYLYTSLGNIIEKRPEAWQLIDGKKIPVACHFALENNELHFVFPDGFDPCYELVIDPLLIFSTFSGSTADNWGSTATPGEHGNLYSSGVTNVSDGGRFPATAGAYQTSSAGLYDIGILKYDSLGSKLLFATYLGGSNSESPHSLVMNNADELVLLGTTSSVDFPSTEGAYDNSFNGGTNTSHVVNYSSGSDIVISRFSKDGTQLLASTYFGGSLNDGLNVTGGTLTRNYGDQLRGDIITDEERNVYVSTVTSSTNIFDVPSGFQSTYQGGQTDALVFKMDPDLSEIIWGTYIGGSAADASYTVKLDHDKNIVLAGGTSSNNFPVTAGSYQETFGGIVDGWIAKISSDGSAILAATYTGTVDYNQIYFLDMNSDEEIYVYGQTSGNFPITPGVYSNARSGQFIQKFNKDLDSLQFSTVFGAGRGIPDISPTAFLVNDCNNLYMAGWGGRVNQETNFWNSGTTGMTTTPDAFQLTTAGSDFYFIVLTDDARERLYATFLGGTQSSTHVDGGTSRFDKGGIVYHSVCSGCKYFNNANKPTSDFPTTPGAWSRVNRSGNCNNAAFKFDLSSLKARLRTNSVKRDMPGIKLVCIPDPIGFENLSTGGEIFNWNFGDGTSVSKTDTAFITHEYKNTGQYLVTLEAIDQGTCQVVDRTSVTVTVNQAHGVIQDDDDMCFGDSYELQAGGGTSYLWTSVDGSFVSAEPKPVVAPKDTAVYYVTLQEENGCVKKDTVQLNVVPGITPQFEWNKLPDCVARPEISVRDMTDSLKSGDVIFFDFGDGTVSDSPEGQHYFEQDGVYDIRIVTRREFCVYEKSVSIPVFEMYIPNVITPGVPEYNDVFTIRYGRVDGVTPASYGYRVSLVIYNRWGHPVFESDDYQYDWSGEGLAGGTYYYEVTVEGHATCKSWLQLVK
jgi:hypothetical protein